MANPKPGSLRWLDYLAAITAELQKTPNASQSGLASALRLTRPVVINLSILRPILDPGTVDKIRQAALSDYTLSYNSVKALAGLEGKVQDFKGAGQAALEAVLFRRMTTRQIKALVEWMVSGKPVSEFDPKKVKRKKAVKPSLSPRGLEPSPKVQPTIGQRIGGAIGTAIDRILEGFKD